MPPLSREPKEKVRLLFAQSPALNNEYVDNGLARASLCLRTKEVGRSALVPLLKTIFMLGYQIQLGSATISNLCTFKTSRHSMLNLILFGWFGKMWFRGKLFRRDPMN